MFKINSILRYGNKETYKNENNSKTPVFMVR